MKFTADELAFLIGKKSNSVYIKNIMDEVYRLSDKETAPVFFGGFQEVEEEEEPEPIVVEEEKPDSQKSLFDF